MVILLTGLISAVLTGVATFFYLRLFRHIRDTVASKGRRVLYYCLASLTYYVLAKVTGVVSVGLGLLPTLVITHYLPRRGLRIITFWSAVLAAVAFVVGAVAAYGYEREKMIWNPGFSWLDTTTQKPKAVNELNRFFISDKIDPTIEFDIIENVVIENKIFKIPILKGATFDISRQDFRDMQADFEGLFDIDEGASDFYTVMIRKGKELLIGCTFQDITHGTHEALKSKLEENRWSMIQNINHAEFLKHLANLTQPIFTSTLHRNPYVALNSPNSLILYAVLDISEANTVSSTPKQLLGLVNGVTKVNDLFMSFSGYVDDPRSQNDESLFLTWFDRFIAINEIANPK